jgi:drug/metabolite transporter (DMT)-like permease
MNGMEALTVVYGLASAASWGAGDFGGGVASKHNSVFRVVVLSQVVGVALLVSLAMVFDEPLPQLDTFALGGLGGMFGMIGLVALYRGLADTRMSVAAPATAVVTAVIPLLASALLEGLPPGRHLTGFGCALLAVWLLARPGNSGSFRPRDLLLPFVAGLGFGAFFIVIDRVSNVALYWPLVAARLASLATLIVVIAARRGERLALPAKQLALIALVGVFDAAGNAFFALATRTGRLDVAAVLSSLYPTATMLLAWLILKERLERTQWIGVILALFSPTLIAA